MMKLSFSLMILGLAVFLPMTVHGDGLEITVNATKMREKTKPDLAREEILTMEEFPNGTIHGGDFAYPREFPWFAASSSTNSAGRALPFCGASLVHSDVLLTAAGCEKQFAIGSTVFVGAFQHDSPSYGAKTRKVARIVRHSAYSPSTFKNDFMLVKLNTPVTDITPVKLNSLPTLPMAGQKLSVLGFGWVNQERVRATLLVKAELSPVSQSVCQSQYENFIPPDGSPFIVDPDLNLCAGAPGGGKAGPCSGDVGGPLVTADGTLVGVVSFGNGCGSVAYSSIYSRVSGAIDWIKLGICELSSNKPTNCNSELLPVVLVMRYDTKPFETFFELKKGNSVLYAGPDAGDALPGPNEAWFYDFGSLPVGQYTLVVRDTACDGLLPSQDPGGTR